MRPVLPALLLSVSLWAQQAQAPADPAAGMIQQAQQQWKAGDTKAALATYQRAVEQYPSSYAAQTALGVALDFSGDYLQARRHFDEAIRVAPGPNENARAQRNYAISYAFEQDCRNAADRLVPVHTNYLTARDYYMAGEIANELARVCLETGTVANINVAERWYRSGYEAGLQEPDIKPDRKDLWDFRLAHAQARIAARRGKHAAAKEFAAQAKAIFAKGTNPAQAPFVPYLDGYLAFYAGDYKAALASLQKANQTDAFILALIAQSYEKLGSKDLATATWRKVLATTAHNPNGAYAVPLARERLKANSEAVRQ